MSHASSFSSWSHPSPGHNQQPLFSGDRMSESSLIAAFGAVLGYIGAEAATPEWFERILWPQRFSAHLDVSSFLMLALFMPMGGPLHKSALQALDVIFSHGLFKGPHQGHMLGTTFYRQQSWKYTMHPAAEHQESHTDVIRNCLWTRVLSHIPMPILVPRPAPQSTDGAEKGIAPAKPSAAPLRARTAVSHLTLSRPTAEDTASQRLPFIAENSGAPGFNTYAAIFAAELSALLTALGIGLAYRSLWALLWTAPLLLRFASALLALKREPLVATSSSTVLDDAPCDFEIQCPQSEGSFMVLTGPPALVLQFFRHYGHPIRSRFREVAQFAIIIAFASHFPIGLLCSAMWMPAEIQYIWLCYQLYVALAMHVVRYSFLGRATTTEAELAKHLGQTVSGAKDVDTAVHESTVLFGEKRNGPGTIKASVSIAYYNRYGEGKEAVKRCLSPRELA